MRNSLAIHLEVETSCKFDPALRRDNRLIYHIISEGIEIPSSDVIMDGLEGPC